MPPVAAAQSGADRPDLSVVIITENEEDLVRQCIESVFDACQVVPSFEVVLVDSASSDRTVEFATEYPITVLRIPEDHTVSCGAGRYVGDHAATGEMVLHVDSDMELTETWLPRAIEHLQADDVAAVEGCLDESTQEGVVEVDKVGGVMLYDADALAEVGGFDPYLLGYEDVAVGYQLTAAGYRLLRLPEVSATHHDEGALTEPIRRWNQGYLLAGGQTIRKWATSPPILRRLVYRQRYKLAALTWVCLGVASLLAWPLVGWWLALSVVGFAYVSSELGVRGAVNFLLAKAFGAVGLLVGMRRRTPPADTYPLDAVEVVAEGPVHEGSAARPGG